jgi:hypothetical protein
MREDLVQALAAAGPQAWRDLGANPTETPMAFGPECEDGWFPLLLRLSTAIQAELDTRPEPDFRFAQVKQKLGELRIYHTGTTNERISQLIERARAEARTTCETCGATPAEVRAVSGRMQCLCETHRQRASPRP